MVQEQNIRVLKAVVIIMGLVIVFGLGVLLVAIGREVSSARSRAGFDATELALPEGARVVQIDLDGDRLAVLLELRDGRQFIQLFDARTGAAQGAVAIQP
jgi:hypothetical protein